MKDFKIITLILMAVLLISSMPYDKQVIYYYTLTQMKNAGSPEKIRLLMADNVATGKPVIQDGVLFTYKDRKAEKVLISGNFSCWRMEKMARGKDGVWFYFLSNNSFSGKVEYKFNVDGLWTEDPSNVYKADDNNGSYLSMTEIEKPSDGKLVTYRVNGRNRILFRTYKPGARIISLVGDFNGWNPEHDLMKRGSDGIWRLEKRLSAGTYRYKFIVDGEWLPDVYNPESASDSAGDICSIIKVQK